jgi:hypothetical protein
MRQFNAPHGNADEMLALPADQLPLGEEFSQVVPDTTLDDLAKALMVFFDL